MRRELQDQWGSQPLITAFLDQLHQLAYRADDSGSSLLISHLPANQDLLSFCCVANDALSGFEWNDQKLRMIGKILLYLLWCPEAHSDGVLSASINEFFTAGIDIEEAFNDFMESALVQWFLPTISYWVSHQRHGFVIDTLQGILPQYWRTVLEAADHKLHYEFTT